MANGWFVMIPPGYAGKSTTEKRLVELVEFYAPGSQNWQEANSGNIVGGKTGAFGQFILGEGDQQLVKWLGPYATEAAARAAAKPLQQSPNPVNDAVNAAVNSTANPISGVTDFLTRLSEPHTWIRIVEVVLGLALAVVALDKLLSGSAAGPAAHKLAKTALLALWPSTIQR